jgi:hypothetical protein
VGAEQPLLLVVDRDVPAEVPALVRAVLGLDSREDDLHRVLPAGVDALGRLRTVVVGRGELEREVEANAVEQASGQIPLGGGVPVAVADDLETVLLLIGLTGHLCTSIGCAVRRPIRTTVQQYLLFKQTQPHSQMEEKNNSIKWTRKYTIKKLFCQEGIPPI